MIGNNAIYFLLYFETCQTLIFFSFFFFFDLWHWFFTVILQITFCIAKINWKVESLLNLIVLKCLIAINKGDIGCIPVC